MNYKEERLYNDFEKMLYLQKNVRAYIFPLVL